MEVPGQEIVSAAAEALLSPGELAAYRHAVTKREASIAPEKAASMFALFLRGTDCAEIARLNRGIALGVICRQRLVDDWDRRRDDYRRALLDSTADRVQQVTLEAIEFLSNELAAAHKLHGDKAKRFLQSGDEVDLGSFAISSIKSYRDTLDVLKELIVGKEVRPDPPSPPPPSGVVEAGAVAVPGGPAPTASAAQVIRDALTARGHRR